MSYRICLCLLAVHRLRQVDRVDKDRIVVVGHSLGRPWRAS